MLLLIAVALSGCTGKGSKSEGAPAVPSAAQAVADAESGSITGFVTDDQELPVPDAGVAIVGRRNETKTDSAGRFTFNGLPPGTYQLAANKIGYEVATKIVTVNVGEISEVFIPLVPIPAEVPHEVVQPRTGVIKCSARWFPAIPVVGTTGLAVCGVSPVDVVVGDKFLLTWIVSEKGAREAFLEMKWQTTQALGRGLLLIWELDGQSNNAAGTLGRREGVSPLTIHANEAKFEQLKSSFNTWDCFAKGCRFQTRVFASANTTNINSPEKIDVGVVVDQPFTQYLTVFHYMTKPSEYTAVQ